MTRALPLLVGLLLVTSGLAGCLSSGGGSGAADAGQGSLSADDADAAPAPGEQADDGGGLAPLAFPASAALDETRWANGSFSAQQACVPAGCAAGEAWQQVELTDLPQQAPTRIEAELTFQAGPTEPLGNMYVYAYTPDGSLYSYEEEWEPGSHTVDATMLVGEEPVTVVVFYSWTDATRAEAEYQLRLDLTADTRTVPAGGAVAVDAEPGQRFRAEPAGEDDGEGSVGLLAYGPEDAYLDRYQADGGSLDLRLPEDSTAGEHVLVVAENASPARLATNSSEAEMRALDYRYEQGQAQPVDGTEPVEWSFDVDRRPLAVGAVAGTNRPLGVTTDEGQVTVSGPEGEVLSSELGCGFCVGESLTAWARTPIGDEALAAGSYDAVYDPDAEVGTQVAGLVVTYER